MAILIIKVSVNSKFKNEINIKQMINDIKILKSKLMIPRSDQTIRRERLDGLLSSFSDKKLTKITAGAGFGKTTLISQFAVGIEANTVWYRIDTMENDYILFIHYLISGIKKYLNGFGDETLQKIKLTENPETDYSDIFTFFLSELEKIEDQKFLIILDDFHHIHENRKIQFFIEYLIENLPDSFHIMILSRTEPEISVSKFISTGEVTEIVEKDLVFTIEEVKSLYLTQFNIEVEDIKFKELHSQTQGWAAGLLLLYHSINSNKNLEISSQLNNIKGSPRIFFNYINENIYKDLPADKKEFLNKTSILNNMNVDSCNDLLEIHNAGQILAGLEKDHLFTVSVDDERGSFFYHHLFRDYLRYKLASENDRKAIINLNVRAARFLEKNDEQEEALNHYLFAKKYDEIVRILSDLAKNHLIVSRVNMFQSILNKIPIELKKCEPWILYSQGIINLFNGMLDDTRKNFDSALVLFLQNNIESGINNCESYLANLDFQSGLFIEAEKKYQKILQKDSLEPVVRLDALGFVCCINIYIGNLEKTDTYFEEADELIKELSDTNVQDFFRTVFLIHKAAQKFVLGDYKEAYYLSKNAEKILSPKFLHPKIHLLYYQQFARTCYHLGYFNEGLESASKGIQILENKDNEDVFMKAWCYVGLALNHEGLNETVKSISFAEKALSTFKILNYLWGVATSYFVLSRIYQKTGDIDHAESFVNKGIEISGTVEMKSVKIDLQLRLVCIDIENKRVSNAYQLLEELFKESIQSISHLACYYYYISCCEFLDGKKNNSIESMIKSLDLCEQNSFNFWEIGLNAIQFKILAQIYISGKKVEYLHDILLKASVDNTTTLIKAIQKKDVNASNRIEKHLNLSSVVLNKSLSANLLGKFRTFVNEKEVVDKSWTSKKALTLCKYLLTFRNKGFIKKEILMELLWPESDPVKTAKRFHVALAALRKILEPEIKRGVPSSFINSSGDSYCLNIGNKGQIDTEIFIKESEKGKKESDPGKMIKHLEKSISKYKGDFLEEDPFADWCMDMRESLKHEYLTVLSKIISYYEDKKEYLKCIEFSNKYLAEDKYAENIYRKLMSFHYKSENKAMVTKTFEKCKKRITEEFDCLDDETIELFTRLKG
ncbi:MAG: hypothetical protein GY714_22135 [Desulfobacterales bacterium]|nr:hypothetical protein [Desulfobacterales bacterium]